MKKVVFLAILSLLFATACEKDKPNSSYSPYFTISPTQKVVFSPGNLQWSATNGGNTATTHTVADGTAAGTWRFASNQWDIIGATNSNVSSTYTGWIDLFGWGTSGYNNKYPYITSTTDSDYGEGSNHIAGTYYDWGVYNTIYNPKTQTTDAPGTWRTLTREEWEYLLFGRWLTIRRGGKFFYQRSVHGVGGIMILPDNFPSYEDLPIDFWRTDWKILEDLGCVFLPAAGYRNGTFYYPGVKAESLYAIYWSTKYFYDEDVYAVSFPYLIDWRQVNRNVDRHLGGSVRLVKEIQ